MKKMKLTFIGLALVIVAIAFGANIKDNILNVGDQNPATNKQINMGSGAFKWNGSTGKMEFSNDQALFFDVGSGSGGGGQGVNFLSFPNAENQVTTGWTCDGSFTVTTTTVEVGFGLASYKLDTASQNDACDHQQESIPNGLKGGNCFAEVNYNGPAGYRFDVVDGSSNLLGSVTLTDSESAWRKAGVSFVCPSSGTLGVRLFQPAAPDPGPIFFDNVHLGNNFTVGQVSQADFVGQFRYDGIANCLWSTTSASFATFAADSDCSATVATGKLQAPDTVIPAFKMLNVEPGNYIVSVQGFFETGTSTLCAYRLSDGTANAGRVQIGPGAADREDNTLIGNFVYTTAQSSIQIEIEGQRISGGGTCNVIADSVTTEEIRFMVTRYPLESQTALRADQSGWFISANITDTGSATPLSTSTVASFSSIGDGDLLLVPLSGSAGVSISCASGTIGNDLTCNTPAVNENYGVLFTPPTAGKYEVCISGNYAVDLGTGSDRVSIGFTLQETTPGTDTVIGGGNTGQQAGNFSAIAGQSNDDAFRVCEIFDFASAILREIKLRFKQDVAGTITGPRLNHSRVNTSYVTVFPVSRDLTSPTIVESISVPERDVFRIVSVFILNSGTPTVDRQHGDWVDNVTDNGVGDTTVNIKAGLFRDVAGDFDVHCTCTGQGGGVFCAFSGTQTSSAISSILTRNDVGGNVDVNFNLICMGLRP